MYLHESLARDRHAERLKQAQGERLARSAAELSRLERRQARAERQLLYAWRRVDELRSTLGSVG
jgi:hypothetical protein